MLTKIEKSIVQEFVNLKIPAIYKFDNTINSVSSSSIKKVFSGKFMASINYLI